MDLYKQSGVDIEKADALVDWIKADKNKVENKLGSPIAGVGGFAALFQPDFSSLEQPVLVTSTDGVGTKLLLALEKDNLEGIGQDLVAMCVNDLYTIGARPLFFLDYYATGALNGETFKTVVKGIQDACSYCQTSLIGGETAELPGLYEKNHFDLAGFVVGVVDKKKALGPEKVKESDVLISLKSNGFHSNGYSLIRKWLKEKPEAYSKELLQPTKLYPIVADLAETFGDAIHSASHITGGGLAQNLARVMPKGVQANIETAKLPSIQWMQTFLGHFIEDRSEVEPTFNLGSGMVLIIEASQKDKVLEFCKQQGYEAAEVGQIIAQASSDANPVVNYR